MICMETAFPTKPGSLGRRSSRGQVPHAWYEDVYGVMHSETPTKTWNSFCDCVMLHLQQVFRYNVSETLKHYITNTLKKPNRVTIFQFFVQVEQLNSYLETLLCLYFSPKVNQAKKTLPLNDADLATNSSQFDRECHSCQY